MRNSFSALSPSLTAYTKDSLFPISQIRKFRPREVQLFAQRHMSSYSGNVWDPVETCLFQSAWSGPLGDIRNIKWYFHVVISTLQQPDPLNRLFD